jgi:hypothetical protein
VTALLMMLATCDEPLPSDYCRELGMISRTTLFEQQEGSRIK